MKRKKIEIDLGDGRMATLYVPPTLTWHEYHRLVMVTTRLEGEGVVVE